MDKEMPKILACGAGLKNTICLTRGKQAFLSQHIGDIFNTQTLDFFKSAINHLKRIFDIEPEIITHDLHPDYISTAFAREQKALPIIGVQHHHAHAASCMAENHLDEPVLAITLDGTGYGTDGNIWGGEILLCTREDFERKAHLSYIRMPGGDAAVLEPWRMAASVLYDAFGRDFLNLNIPYIKEMDEQQLAFVIQMMEKDLNCPLTSSCGRLFDAVASLLCICHTISHESQAAMELEALTHVDNKEFSNEKFSDETFMPDGLVKPSGTKKDDSFFQKETDENYDFSLIRNNEDELSLPLKIDMTPCIRGIVEDIKKGKALEKISTGFHDTIVSAFAKTAKNLEQESRIQKIVLSGGVFNNDRILNHMITKLEHDGFRVYTHSKVPTGDGGICLGQAVVAGKRQDFFVRSIC
jgi:hydrogenase maturation protein HypF